MTDYGSLPNSPIRRSGERPSPLAAPLELSPRLSDSLHIPWSRFQIPFALSSVRLSTSETADTSLKSQPTKSTHDAVTVGETYRVALLDTPPARASAEQDASQPSQTQRRDRQHSPGPPVAEGEVREVTIETIGDQGDGIAKVERGYVVIVPEVQPGQ